MIQIAAEAASESKRMTFGELVAFVEQAKAAGVPDTAELDVATKGLGRLKRISTASPK